MYRSGEENFEPSVVARNWEYDSPSVIVEGFSEIPVARAFPSMIVNSSALRASCHWATLLGKSFTISLFFFFFFVSSPCNCAIARVVLSFFFPLFRCAEPRRRFAKKNNCWLLQYHVVEDKASPNKSAFFFVGGFSSASTIKTAAATLTYLLSAITSCQALVLTCLVRNLSRSTASNATTRNVLRRRPATASAHWPGGTSPSP